MHLGNYTSAAYLPKPTNFPAGTTASIGPDTYANSGTAWVAQAPGGGVTLAFMQSYVQTAIAAALAEFDPGNGEPPLTYAVSIDTQPVARTITETSALALSVEALGTAPISYIWEKSTNGGSTWAVIVGASNAAYFKANAVVSDTGLYRVRADNDYGPEVTSNAVQVTVTANSGDYSLVTGAWDVPSQGGPFTESTIFLGTAPGVYTQQRTLAGNSTGATVTGLPNAGPWFYAVSFSAGGFNPIKSLEHQAILAVPS